MMSAVRDFPPFIDLKKLHPFIIQHMIKHFKIIKVFTETDKTAK